MSNPAIQKISQFALPQILGISVLIGGFYYKSLYDDGSSLESQIQTVQGQVQVEEEKKKETDRIKSEEVEMKKQVGELAEKFKEITMKFPINLKSDEIIDVINSLSKTVNVRVISVKKEKVITQELYEEVPIKLELSGTFNNLLLLLYNITILERVTNFGDFEFLNSASEYNGVINLSTTVIGYKYRKPPEVNPENGNKNKNDTSGGA